MRVVIVALLLMQMVGLAAIPPNPVVVELFESEGCSSCPPAERVMKELLREFGPSVILLTYHVDYWDSLGWKDPFSDGRNTERQKAYARSFSQDTIYTPELVIQGEIGLNGADWRRARTEIASRLQSARSGFGLTLQKKESAAVTVSVRLPPDLAAQARELTLVLFENAAPVHVLRGENRGATMSGDFAVRQLAAMPRLQKGHSALTISIDPSWDPAALGAVVLVKGDSPRILAAEEKNVSGGMPEWRHSGTAAFQNGSER